MTGVQPRPESQKGRTHVLGDDMTTMGMRGVFAAVLLGSFGLLGANAAPVAALPVALAAAPGAGPGIAADTGPGLWARTRHGACVISRAASGSERQGSDRRAHCDRELLANH